MKKQLLYVLLSTLCLSVQAKELKMESPDGKYLFSLNDDGGRLSYSLNWNGQKVVNPSLLGIRANEDWHEGLSIEEVSSSERDTVWHPVYGERSTVKDKYRMWSVTLTRAGAGGKLVLDVRAYDEGIAFRYRFPGGQYLKITDEYTEYSMPEEPGLTSRQERRHLISICRWRTGLASRTVLCCLPFPAGCTCVWPRPELSIMCGPSSGCLKRTPSLRRCTVRWRTLLLIPLRGG